MFFKKQYKNSIDFHTQNQIEFDKVRTASTKLKSMSELSIGGSALYESEKLTFEFLNLSSVCSDLLFGLGSSVGDAKSKIKQIEGIFFRDLKTKTPAADKVKLVQCLSSYIEADQNYNDLNDLKDYIEMKKKDFDSAYYYYRDINNKK